MRRWMWSLVAVAVLLGAVAHVAFWYLPRERAAAPAAGAPATAVWSNASLPLRLWIPYPHQNLVAIRRGAPKGLASVLRLFGVKTPQLPRFGPFDVPPSSAIAIAADSRGEHFIALAQVYPAIAAVARAAGRIAGNPWLGGGEVEDGGRRLRIGWRPGNVWWVTTEASEDVEELFSAPAVVPDLPAALAWLRAERSLGPLPAGDYRLEPPARAPKLIHRDAAGRETTVLDLGGDGTHLDIHLPNEVPAE